MNETRYGENLLLSPDGRFVAGDSSIDGTEQAEQETMPTSVLDLTTGQVRTFDAGTPVGPLPSRRRKAVSENRAQ